ncbi:hypothetical protein C7M84_012679 [Penaeus vannamei]|uniref:Uncharacterized protein n=1 Tax=Penaeus vannamei TaxID=6689 RepID=A0A3R7Q5I9_PENVA|nr:hypothetical protein C7M84_012679 [Penaeus vannamei]
MFCDPGSHSRLVAEQEGDASSPLRYTLNTAPQALRVTHLNCLSATLWEGLGRFTISCKYKKEKEICDCGESETPVGPICVGIFSGILIIGFWITTINRTIDSHKQKQSIQQVEESASEQSTPRAYPLTPVASSAPTETAAAQNTGGTEDPALNPAAAPPCPPYSFNTPEAPSFAPTAPNEPPPPYSLYPSNDQSLPSHTPSQFPSATVPPVSESSSVTPCPPNPSTLPYPYSP